jgi:hypothetical protein
MVSVLGGNYNLNTDEKYDQVLKNSSHQGSTSFRRNKHTTIVDKDVAKDRELSKGHENISPV